MKPATPKTEPPPSTQLRKAVFGGSRMKINLICAIWLALALSGSAQSTIAYFNGPAFSIPGDGYTSTSLDLNQDGIGDFSFSGGPFLCTSDVPSSGCTSAYLIASLNTNSVLCQDYNVVVVMPAGTTIGSVASSNTVWKNSDGATLVTAFFSPRYGTSGWGGPLSLPGAGYLGVRFYAQDGLHYGWIHAWLPDSRSYWGAPLPVILDWAYETRPDTAIAAGAVPVAPLASPKIVRAGNLRLDWQSAVGAAYQVQFKEQLILPAWTNLDFTIIATATNTAVDVPMLDTARFYRIVQAE